MLVHFAGGIEKRDVFRVCSCSQYHRSTNVYHRTGKIWSEILHVWLGCVDGFCRWAQHDKGIHCLTGDRAVVKSSNEWPSTSHNQIALLILWQRHLESSHSSVSVSPLSHCPSTFLLAVHTGHLIMRRWSSLSHHFFSLHFILSSSFCCLFEHLFYSPGLFVSECHLITTNSYLSQAGFYL